MKLIKCLVVLMILPVFLCSCASFQETSFGNYSEAEKAFTKGKYEKAIEKYQAYLTEYPGGNMAIIAEYYIAKSYAALGKTDEARQAFQNVIAKHPGSDWADFAKKRLEDLTPAK